MKLLSNLENAVKLYFTKNHYYMTRVRFNLTYSVAYGIICVKLHPNTAQQGELNWPQTLPFAGHITTALPRKHPGIRLKKASSKEVCMDFCFLKFPYVT